MSDKLKPCPKCGDDATIGQAAADKKWYAGCLRDNCDGQIIVAETRDIGVADWNNYASDTRTTPQEGE